MRTIIPVLTGLILSLAPAPALSADEDDAQDATRARLDAGEVLVFTEEVPDSDTPRVKALGVVDAPPDKVWRVVDRCGDYAETMIKTRSSEEVSRKGGRVRCDITVKLPFPLKNLRAVTDAVHTVKPGEKWSREWKLVEGDYDRNSGSWNLVPFDDEGTRTLVVYEVHADPKIRIPAGIQRMAQKKSIPNLFEHLRETLE
ncbi:MAG: SRPBCC family protein [Myxococcota bacterium]